MWAAEIFPLHCFGPKLITVRFYWQGNQRQDGLERERDGRAEEEGRRRRRTGGLFLFHNIPTHDTLQHYGLQPIEKVAQPDICTQTLKRRHRFNQSNVFSMATVLLRTDATANSSLMREATSKAPTMRQ